MHAFPRSFAFVVLGATVLSSTGCMSMMMGRMKEKMFVVKGSAHDFDTTVQRVKEAMATLPDWQLIDTYDNQQRYQEVGDIGKQVVIVVCKPKVAVKLLGSDENKRMAGMIPLKIAVSRYSDGKTHVSWMNVGMMADMYEGDLNQALRKAGEQLKAKLHAALAPAS